MISFLYTPLARTTLDLRNRWRSKPTTIVALLVLAVIAFWVVGTITQSVAIDYLSLIAVCIWPILSGILVSFLVVVLLYRLQQPNLVVSPAEDKYDEKSDTHYVHLK